MKIFEPKKGNIIMNIILALLFVTVVTLASEKVHILLPILLVILLAYFFLLFLFRKRVVQIKIDKDYTVLKITYQVFIIKKVSEEFQIQSILATFKREVGPRGIKNKELRDYNREKQLLFTIAPNFEGWNERDLEELFQILQKDGSN